jgi:hypothetical protein
MTEIYSNDTIKIIENKKNSLFKMVFSNRNEILIRSLIKTGLIKGSTVSDDYKSIQFRAISVKKINKKLSIPEATTLISDLAIQLNYLITVEGYSIIGYMLENIIVINDNRYIFIGCNMITEIDENNKILISCPFNNTDLYMTPELLQIKELPTYIHYKTVYYSLGCLALHALQIKETDFLISNSNGIKYTKLYWLLSRCLVKDVESRSILYI